MAVAVRDYLFGPRIVALRWILASAACLMMIAAANGAGMWMTRWLRTRRELAIRLSLGASGLRLAGIRAAEGVMAGLTAGAVAVAAAAVLLRLLHAAPFVGAAVGLFAAVLPHLSVMRRLVRDGTREGMATHPATRRVRLVLTTTQLAATAILAWTAIAIGENAHTLLTAERGFDTEDTLIAGIGVPEARYDTDERMTDFHGAAIAQLKAVPGVVAAAGGVNVPVGNLPTRFLRDGQALEREQQPFAGIGVVSPELLPLLIASSVQLEKAVLRPTPTSVTLCLLTMGVVTIAAAFQPVRRAAAVSAVDALREQ